MSNSMPEDFGVSPVVHWTELQTLRAENERLQGEREADAVKLLAALEDSRQEVERLKADLAAERNNIVLYADDRNEWREKAERLRAALERIEGMAERPTCVCGVPTGTAAIRQAARSALGRTKRA